MVQKVQRGWCGALYLCSAAKFCLMLFPKDENPVEPNEPSEPVEPKQVKKTTLSGSLFYLQLIYPSRLFLCG